MKFSPVVLSCVVQLALQARPSFVARSQDDTECGYTRNAKTIADDCADPGHKPQIGIHDCDAVTGWYCTDIICTTRCCSRNENLLDEKCKCIHQGESYGNVQKYGSDNCCGTNAAGTHNKIRSDNICGGSDIGSKPRHGSTPADCSSGEWDPSTKRCVARPCKKRGARHNNKADTCCRSMHKFIETKDGSVWTTRTAYEQADGGTCTCIHAGKAPHEYDKVNATNCCSGHVGGDGNCTHITNHSLALTDGASAKDCAIGSTVTKGTNTYCEAAECLGLGETVPATGGEKCCSGKKVNDICKCIPPGQEATGGKTSCCSGRIKGTSNLCDHLYVSETPTEVTDVSVCLSNRLDAKGRCACFPAGHNVSDPTQCCSLQHEPSSNSVCGCMANGAPLRKGAWKRDCCSKHSHGGECSCAPPGFPTLPAASYLNGAECCAGYAKGGYCGCYGPDHNIAGHQKHFCCGGFHNASTHQCTCVPRGYAVASFVNNTSCCGSGISDGACGIGDKA